MNELEALMSDEAFFSFSAEVSIGKAFFSLSGEVSVGKAFLSFFGEVSAWSLVRWHDRGICGYEGVHCRSTKQLVRDLQCTVSHKARS